MKSLGRIKLIGLIFSCLIIMAGFSTGINAQKQASKFIYNGYTWGMSKNQIQRAVKYKVVSKQEDELYYLLLDHSISDADQVSLRFNFGNNGLKEFSIIKTFVDDDDKAEDQYKNEKSDLSTLFGNPVKEDPSYKEDYEPDVYWMCDSTQIVLSRYTDDAVNIHFLNLKKDVKKPGVRETGQIKSEIVFSDSFNNNVNQWGVAQEPEYNSSIENGVFKVQVLNTNGRYFSRPVQLDSTKDFAIECKTTWLDGIDDNGYGIIWGHKNWNDTKIFKISANQFYRIWDSKNGDNGLTGWIKSVYINAKGENYLKIVRKGETLEYYINGYLVQTTGYRGFKGNFFGVIINDKQTVAFDDFKITTRGDTPAKKALKPNFGNLTIYTKNNKGKVLSLHIEPVLTLEDLTAHLNDLSHGPSRYGMNSGHWAKLYGTLDFVKDALPVNDFYDGTNGNDDQPIKQNLLDGENGLAVGPFAGTNWNNFDEGEGDYYYSINLPYGKYKITLSSNDSDSSVFGQQEIVINKNSTILPITLE